MVDAVTAIDGYLYTILIRDSDKSNMKKVAETIFQTFHVASQNFNDTLELKNCNVSTSLPNNWRIMEQRIETIEDVGESDYALIEVYDDDGTRRYIALTIMDYYSLSYGTKPTKMQRLAFNKTFSKQMALALIQSQGLEPLSSIQCEDTEFYALGIDDDPQQAMLIGLPYGYLFRIEIAVPIGDALSDPVIPQVQSFVKALISKF